MGFPYPHAQPKNWRELINPDPVVRHAKHWSAVSRCIREHQELLGDRYIAVRCEDLCKDVRGTLAHLWVAAETPEKESLLS